MELPAEVLIHNELVGMKGAKATLLQVSAHGYYEANVRFGDLTHRVMLPIASTVVISQEAEEQAAPKVIDVER